MSVRIAKARSDGTPCPHHRKSPSEAMQNGFLSGDYHTTTMQDCCRPTCAWADNVANTTSGWSQFYTCDASGAPR